MREVFKPKTHEIAKVIFENLRNTSVCVAIAIAAGVVLRFPEISLFGPKYAIWVSWTLLTLASVLLVWNMVLGFDRLLQTLPPTSWRVWPLYMVAALLLVVVTVSMLGALLKLQFAALPLRATGGASVSQNASP